ncbi:MAG: NAD(+)/NADH kinase [Candidatus Aminicenantia bacterium]
MIEKIGIIVRPSTKEVEDVLREVSNWAENRKIEVLLDLEAAKILGVKGVRRKELPEKSDLIIALGGDGTILSIAPECAISGKPVMGINVGTLGFLAEFGKQDAIQSLERIVNGDFTISKRAMLEINYKGQTFSALNEATISKAFPTRLIELTVFVNDVLLATIRGDGLIFSTATGSTAYSLSAGGPILEPSLECVIITPISPHTLSARPIVLPPSSVIKMESEERENDIHLIIDGKFCSGIEKGSPLIIKNAPYHFLLISSFKKSFYELLRDKLRWRGKLMD